MFLKIENHKIVEQKNMRVKSGSHKVINSPTSDISRTSLSSHSQNCKEREKEKKMSEKFFFFIVLQSHRTFLLVEFGSSEEWVLFRAPPYLQTQLISVAFIFAYPIYGEWQDELSKLFCLTCAYSAHYFRFWEVIKFYSLSFIIEGTI